MAKKKVVQGTYISVEAREIFKEEAKTQGVFLSRIVSEILERAANRLKNKKKEEVQ